ncbi:hypothetical protein CLOP_g18018 [Closterium sp. NIES-67]|nr:hypothetical protein CLOP_g18018 [Closterium sp. NIES-67]
MTRARKHVKASALGEPVSVGEGEQILRVVAPRGSNLIELEDGRGTSMLCMLPAKFHRMLWLKRGSFVVADVSAAEEVDKAGGRVRGSITAVIFDHHIKELIASNQWPEAFAEATAKDRATTATSALLEQSQLQGQQEQHQQGGELASTRGEGDVLPSSQGTAEEGAEEQRRSTARVDGHVNQEGEVEEEEGEDEDDGLPPLERNPNHRSMFVEDVSDDDSEDEE